MEDFDLEDKASVISHLHELYRSQLICDLSIVCDDHEFKLHKIALAMHSRKFLNIFTENMKVHEEIVVVGIWKPTMGKIIEYLYTSNFELELTILDEVLSVCSQLQLEDLILKCKDFLRENLDANTALAHLATWQKHKFSDVELKMKMFAAANIEAVGPTSGWLQLRVQDVCDIIILTRGSATDIKSEMERHYEMLAYLAWKWIQADTSKRIETCGKLLACLGLDKCPARTVGKLVQQLPQLLQQDDCARILCTTMRCCALQNCTCDENISLWTTNYDKKPNFLDGPALMIIGGCDAESLKNTDMDIDLKMDGSCILKWHPQFNKQWMQVSKLPSGGRYGHSAILADKKLYILGGVIHDTKAHSRYVTNSVEIYDGKSSVWCSGKPMQMGRKDFAAVCVANKIYVFGGEDNCKMPINSIEMYDTSRDEWEMLNEILGIPRSGLRAAVIENEIFVIGGCIGGHLVDLVECFDVTTNQSEILSALPFAVASGRLESLNNCLFYFGGEISVENELRSSNLVWRYNYENDTWSETGQLSKPVHNISSAVIGNNAYIVGGFSSITGECEILVPRFNANSYMSQLVTNLTLPFPVTQTCAIAIT